MLEEIFQKYLKQTYISFCIHLVDVMEFKLFIPKFNVQKVTQNVNLFQIVCASQSIKIDKFAGFNIF